MSAGGAGEGSSEGGPESGPWPRSAEFGEPWIPPEPPRANGHSKAGADSWPDQSPAYPPPGQPDYVTPFARTNPLAIAALVCGIGQFFLGLLLVGNILLAVPAVICGAIGRRQIRQRGERGSGLATAGLVLGILGVIYFLLVVVLLVVAGLHYRST